MTQQRVESIIVTGKENVQLRSTYSTAPFNVLGGALFQGEVVLKNHLNLPLTPPEGSFYYSNGNFWGYCGPLRGWVSWTQDIERWDNMWDRWKDDLPLKPFYGLDNEKIEGWTFGLDKNLAIGREFTQPGVSLEVGGPSIFDHVQVKGFLKCEQGIRVGDHNKTVQGNIRYHDGLFQGYNGSSWINFHGTNWIHWLEPVDWLFLLKEGESVSREWYKWIEIGSLVWTVLDVPKKRHIGWFRMNKQGELEKEEDKEDIFQGVMVRNLVKNDEKQDLLSTIYFLQDGFVTEGLIEIERKRREKTYEDIGLQCKLEKLELPDEFHLSPGCIDSSHLKNQILQTYHFNEGIIRGDFIESKAIKSHHLSPECFQTDHLGEGVIDGRHIGRNVITSVHLSEGCLREHHLPSNGFHATRLLEKSSIDADMIAMGAIRGDKLSDKLIESHHLRDDVILARHISEGTIQPFHLCKNIIKREHIADGTIQIRHLEQKIFQPEGLHGNIIQTGTGRSEWFKPGTLPGWLIKNGTLHGSIISEGSIEHDKISPKFRGFHVRWDKNNYLTGPKWVELGGKLEIEWNENAAIWEKVESVDPTRGWTFVRRVREDSELGDRSIFERIQWSQYGYREPWFQPDARWSRVEFFGHMISQGVWQHEGPWNQRGIMNLNEAEVKWHDYETTKQQLHRVWSHSLYHSCPRGVIMGWQEDKPPSGWRFLDDIPSPDGFRWIQKVEVSVEPTLLGEGTEEVGDISSSMIEETNNEEDKSDK